MTTIGRMKSIFALLALQFATHCNAQAQERTSCTDLFAFQPTESSEKFFTSILNPITVDDFFESHFQQKAASAQRPGMPSYYGPMVSFEDVEYAIENGFKVSNPNQRLVYGKDWKLAKRVFRDDDYWTGLYQGEAGAEVGVEEAMAAVSRGFTVIMNGVQSSMPNVYQAAWQLEAALGWHVNVNLYISPPGGAQGFEAHLDWMDGFILQVTGQKRWKVYEPPLVSFPRPDLVRKPPLNFLQTDSTESDLFLRAGDFAYIPRGVVHQAHTSAEDVARGAGSEQDSYQQASMHLTFGIELAKDASVEMLLHHFVTELPPSAFDPLLSALPHGVAAGTSAPFVFQSDDAEVSFQCGSSAHLGPTGCTEKDVMHLLLAAMAGHISEDEQAFMTDTAFLEEASQPPLSTSLLRQAVGVTRRTARLPALDPRQLLPLGAEVLGAALRELGVSALLRFLLDKKMLTVTRAPSAALLSCSAASRENSAAAECAMGTDTLTPPGGSSQSYVTLGSDFSCEYIDSFFSKSFKTKGAKRLELRVVLANETRWQHLQSAQDERSYDSSALLAFLSEHSWAATDHVLGDFVDLAFARALQRPPDSSSGGVDTADASAGAAGASATDASAPSKKKKKRRRTDMAGHEESEVYCEAWSALLSALAADKDVRKKSGLAALQNAGYQMNAS